jgi:aspartyl protease family protein
LTVCALLEWRPRPYITRMDGNDFGQLAYLVLLGLVIAGYFVAQNRQGMGKTAQQAAVWGLIFVGAIAAAGMWGDIRRDVAPRAGMQADGRIEVPVSRDGHYHMTLDINGQPVDFIVDTGASQMVLSRADAARVGLDPGSLAFLGSAQTANGVVRTAQVTLDTVAFCEMTDARVRAVVNDGAMDGSLLGMTYLSRFSRIEIENGRLVLSR